MKSRIFHLHFVDLVSTAKLWMINLAKGTYETLKTRELIIKITTYISLQQLSQIH